MRKNIVAGLACMLLALPACPAESGDTDSSTGTAPGTTDNATSTDGTATTAPTTGDTGGPVCVDPPPEGVGGVMSEFGAPCDVDDDCKAILGDDGVCLTDILSLYGLPCGYCSRLCDLPPGVGYQPDDMICGMGVTCIGADGYFEGCVVECTDDSDCPREGYECRVMPQIGQPTDPKFCLMKDEYML